ncbi:MAG: FtsX-like permease family protein [Streptosporangiaceae bacterium]
MRAVWLVLAAEFRRRWRSWLLLGLLVAVASGFVLASTAAGRRTDSAFPRYVASHGYDAIVYTVQPLPQLGRQDEVAQVTPVQMPFAAQPGCSCHRRVDHAAFSVREVPPASLGRVLLGSVVAVCGLAALAHLLVVSVARRRTESGLLVALGMVRRQLATIVFWQATTVAIIAVAAGVPLGIAAGRAIWRAFAISLGVVPVPVVQAWLIVALAAGALLAANALAAVPAMSAARSRPGQLLRAE